MSEADRSDLQYARDRWRRTREDSQLHRQRLRDMGSLVSEFGPAVSAAAERHLEELLWSAEAAVRYYERAVEALHIDLAQARAEVDRLLAIAVSAKGEGVEDAL